MLQQVAAELEQIILRWIEARCAFELARGLVYILRHHRRQTQRENEKPAHTKLEIEFQRELQFARVVRRVARGGDAAESRRVQEIQCCSGCEKAG